MKKTNKCVALVLAVITIFSAFSIVPITASAEEVTTTTATEVKIIDSGECGKKAKWKIDSNGLLTVYGKGAVEYDKKLAGYIEGKIKEVKVLDGITKLPYHMFSDSFNLKKATIADSVKSLGELIFGYCGNLKTVTIGNGVTKLPYGAFADCSSLKSVKLGTGLKFLPTNTFVGCEKVNSITIPKKNKNLCTVDSVIYSKNKKTLIYYPQGKKKTTYSVLKETKTIEKFAFAYSVNLKKVNIPTSVNTIKTKAFIHCKNLKKLTIPSSVKTIGSKAYGYQYKYYAGTFGDETIIIKTKGCTIYGKKGSTANKYSTSNKIKFVKTK